MPVSCGKPGRPSPSDLSPNKVKPGCCHHTHSWALSLAWAPFAFLIVWSCSVGKVMPSAHFDPRFTVWQSLVFLQLACVITQIKDLALEKMLLMMSYLEKIKRHLFMPRWKQREYSQGMCALVWAREKLDAPKSPFDDTKFFSLYLFISTNMWFKDRDRELGNNHPKMP